MVAMIKNEVQGNVVGLLADPDSPLLVGILGALKSGHGFLPLDPKSPVERLRFALADCGVRVLAVTAEHLEKAVLVAEGLDALTDIICLDGPADVAVPGRAKIHSLRDVPAAPAAPESRADADGLAYVIYTSGSTGAPKGVPITHRNIMPLLAWSRGYFGLGEHTRVLQNLAPWFDFGVFELLTTMLFGGTLFFPDRTTQDTLSGFADFITRHSLDTVHSTPSFFQRVIASRARLETLRLVHLGGEQLTRRALEEVFAAVGDECVVYNGYGPTEASVNCAIYNAGTPAAPADGAGDSTPIGRPTANNTLYVLDRNMGLVPLGVPGELYVGGAGLSHGYLNRPALTAERFVPDPFSTEPGARLYRTGDLVRRLHPDGRIEFLGRLDFQVKIRGFRVEPGEIEAALLAHPHVRHCAVLAPQEQGGGRRLVAYVAGADGPPPAASELREFLRARLPAYMVPSEFVAVEEMPLTPSGKVDRRALEATGARASATDDGAAEGARTPLEEMLAGLWAGLLGVERVGREDNFFDLGGHSLLATQLAARVREVFKAELPIRVVFEWPTLEGMAARIGEALQSGEQPPLAPIGRTERDGPLPLSFAQERLWFLNQLDPDSAAYHVLRPVRVKGRLDVEKLGEAFSALIARHEILRTGFPSVGGRPVQHIRPAWRVAVPVIDLRQLPEAEREAEAHRLVLEESRRTFDLTEGPLWRIKLLWLGEDDYVLLLVEHHMMHDGWTEGVLVRDVLALYNAALEGRDAALPSLPIQYADFAAWQRGWLTGEVLERLLSFWREELKGAPPVLELPSGLPRPAAQSFRGATQTLVLPASLAEAIARLSRGEDVTPFMTLLAAFQTLLYRHTGQEDIVLGSPVAGRSRVETEGLLGFFVNTLVFRTDLSGDPTFRELLTRVRETALRAYAHQDLPFEKLVEELQPRRDPTRNPLFQVMFVLQNAPRTPLEVPGLDLHLVHAHNGTSKFDLLLSLREVNGELEIVFEYDSDVFDGATIARLRGHYRTLLEAVVADPSQRLAALPLLTEAERRELLTDWNDTREDYPREACLHELFEEQAARTPDAVAVAFGDASLSYGELNRRANRLARGLRRLGVGPDTPVGVCMRRSVEMVVGLLGILKAGGCYLPLDPEYPRERLSFMLEDAGAPVLLTEEALAGVLPQHSARVVTPERFADDEGGADGDAEDNFPSGATPDSLLYLIYTSGSTGWPKGVAMTHRPLTNLLSWQLRRSRLGPGAATLQFTSLSFDVATQEIFSTLCAGGRLELIAEDSRRDMFEVLRLCDERRVGRVYMPFVALQHLADIAGSGGLLPSSLREVVTAGEQLQVTPQLESLFARLDGCTLHNQYGPSETHVVTAYDLGPRPHDWPRLPPIGRPVANTQIYVLDSRLRPVPVNVSGELYIGGDSLARGYHKRPGLTAERFVPDPFSTEPGARLYRTGDLARYRADGDIEFLGRLDTQVKVRGFRVELGEIEATLRAHASVREAVVVAAEDARAGRRLVAYVVPRQEASARAVTDELRAHLKERLPDQMIPSAFVVLDELPLTPSGKVDRRRLPAPDRQGDEPSGAEAPATPTEEVIAGIWAEALGLARVGRDDDFFELGGHSLLATQIVSRVRELFRVELPVRSLFESPTVAALAAVVTREAGRQRGLQAPPIRPAARGEELPLSFAQQRLWFLSQLEPDSPFYSLPVAVRLSGRLDAGVLERAVNEVISRHESLRTNFVRAGARPVQVIAPSRTLRLKQVDLGRLPATLREERLRELALEETRRPFDLTSDLLVRVTLFRLGDEDQVALLNMHHIISDGWSLGVIVHEVSRLYAAFAEGREPPLQELPVQYADFAVWQHEWLQGEVIDAQLAYWERQLNDLPALKLPTDFPRPGAQSFRGARLDFGLSPAVTAALKALGRREGATLYMTLLAAFEVLLHRYSGQEDFAVGVDVANRGRREVEGLIGFFVNMLVMRADLSGDPTFRELLGRVRETALDAYAHQDVPFDRVVERLRPTRDPSRNPLFQVLLALQNTRPVAMELPGVKLTPFDLEFHTSKFDLLFALLEQDGGLNGYAHYDTALFSAASVARMLRHLSNILEAAVADPDQRVSSIRLLSEDETAGLGAEDFPDAGLDQQEFESLAMEINKLSEVN